MVRSSSRIKKTFSKIHLSDKLNTEQKNENRNDKISTPARQTRASCRKKAKDISKESTIKVKELNACLEENIQQFKTERVGSKDDLQVICKFCNEKFSSQENYHAHVCEDADKTQYICRPCSKEFSTLRSLIRHRKNIHNGKKEHHCDVCGKSFADKTALERHQRSHTGERPFVCHICHKGYADKSYLNTHIKFHTNDFAHKCVHCGKKFWYRSVLLKHTASVHTGLKNYKCDICDKDFSRKENLNRHKNNMHTIRVNTARVVTSVQNISSST